MDEVDTIFSNIEVSRLNDIGSENSKPFFHFINRLSFLAQSLAGISKEMVSKLKLRLDNWDVETTVIGDVLVEMVGTVYWTRGVTAAKYILCNWLYLYSYNFVKFLRYSICLIALLFNLMYSCFTVFLPENVQALL